MTVLLGAIRSPAARRSVLWTLLAVVLLRLGQNLPLPGLDTDALRTAAAQSTGDSAVFRLLDLLSGGGLARLSVFSSGIWPYVLAAVVMNLLLTVSPHTRAIAAAGEAGAARLARYRRVVTVLLGLAQGIALVAVARSRDVLAETRPAYLVAMVLCLAAGSAVVMLLAELITAWGVGSGWRLLLLVPILAASPKWFRGVYEDEGPVAFTVALVLVVVTIAGKIILTQAERRVPVQYAKRMVGRRAYGGSAKYIPLTLVPRDGQAVLGISMLLFLPVVAAEIWPGADWLRQPFLQDEGDAWHLAAFFLLIVAYAWISALGAFDPDGQASTLYATGAFVPGIRPGRSTAMYLGYVHLRLSTAGALLTGIVALTPVLGFALLGAGPDLWFASAIVFFLVEVAMGTVKQVEFLAMMRLYEGFLR